MCEAAATDRKCAVVISKERPSYVRQCAEAGRVVMLCECYFCITLNIVSYGRNVATNGLQWTQFVSYSTHAIVVNE